ncbi:MAG: hypothetical protein ABI221_03185 [Candidatus Saccharimonadales bacterium]
MPKKIIQAESSKREYHKFWAVLIFMFLAATLMSTLISFRWLDWLRWYVACTLLIFGGFKMISYESFLDVFPRYNALARRYSWYGLAYPVAEVLLAVFFVLDVAPGIRQVIVLLAAGIGLASMANNLMHKGPSAKNTWLGGLFRLPMTTALLFEDGILFVLVLVIIVGNLFVK